MAGTPVAGIVGHRDLDLVGARVYAEEKAGRDVGELCGIEPLGVIATSDEDALLAMDADCAVFMVGRDWVRDPTPRFEELLRILRSGKNVLNLWWPSLVYPRGMDGDVYEQLQAACLEGGSSFCTFGMDPGNGTAQLALTALGMAREVESVEMIQFMNNAGWEGPVITDFFGFGAKDASNSPLLQPGMSTRYHGTTVHLVAEAMGLEVDEILEEHELIYAEDDFDVLSGTIPAGTVSGIRYRVKGMVGGKAKVIVGHVERLRDEDFPELEFKGDGYRAEVDGLPCVRLDMNLSPPPSYEGDCIAVASAMCVVNAIPAVCDAPPGVLSLRDIRPFPSRNLN